VLPIFLLSVEIEGDPPGRMEVEEDALMAVETDLFLMLMTVINVNVLLQLLSQLLLLTMPMLAQTLLLWTSSLSIYLPCCR